MEHMVIYAKPNSHSNGAHGIGARLTRSATSSLDASQHSESFTHAGTQTGEGDFSAFSQESDPSVYQGLSPCESLILYNGSESLHHLSSPSLLKEHLCVTLDDISRYHSNTPSGPSSLKATVGASTPESLESQDYLVLQVRAEPEYVHRETPGANRSLASRANKASSRISARGYFADAEDPPSGHESPRTHQERDISNPLSPSRPKKLRKKVPAGAPSDDCSNRPRLCGLLPRFRKQRPEEVYAKKSATAGKGKKRQDPQRQDPGISQDTGLQQVPASYHNVRGFVPQPPLIAYAGPSMIQERTESATTAKPRWNISTEFTTSESYREKHRAFKRQKSSIEEPWSRDLPLHPEQPDGQKNQHVSRWLTGLNETLLITEDGAQWKSRRPCSCGGSVNSRGICPCPQPKLSMRGYRTIGGGPHPPKALPPAETSLDKQRQDRFSWDMSVSTHAEAAGPPSMASTRNGPRAYRPTTPPVFANCPYRSSLDGSKRTTFQKDSAASSSEFLSSQFYPRNFPLGGHNAFGSVHVPTLGRMEQRIRGHTEMYNLTRSLDQSMNTLSMHQNPICTADVDVKEIDYSIPERGISLQRPIGGSTKMSEAPRPMPSSQRSSHQIDGLPTPSPAEWFAGSLARDGHKTVANVEVKTITNVDGTGITSNQGPEHGDGSDDRAQGELHTRYIDNVVVACSKHQARPVHGDSGNKREIIVEDYPIPGSWVE